MVSCAVLRLLTSRLGKVRVPNCRPVLIPHVVRPVIAYDMVGSVKITKVYHPLHMAVLDQKVGGGNKRIACCRKRNKAVPFLQCSGVASVVTVDVSECNVAWRASARRVGNLLVYVVKVAVDELKMMARPKESHGPAYGGIFVRDLEPGEAIVTGTCLRRKIPHHHARSSSVANPVNPVVGRP